jgi:7tm Odorant receptor
MVLFKVSFLCHLGNFLTESSQLVVESIVLSDWHEQSTNTKLCVKMMQTQALRGCDLTAGKFFKLDFITLQIILKAGYSYFTFLEVIN